MHFCGYIAHYPPPCGNDAHLPTCPSASLLGPHQPITCSGLTRRSKGGGQRPRCPLPPWSLEVLRQGAYGKEGALGAPSLGPGPVQGGHVPHPSCFWIPAPLWVCGCVCMRVCACVCVGVCFNFLYGKMDKKIEREVFNCNKLASVAPP